MELFKIIKESITPPPVDVVAKRNLYQAQIDLLKAEENAEDWNTRVQVLRARVQRLEAMQQQFTKAGA